MNRSASASFERAGASRSHRGGRQQPLGVQVRRGRVRAGRPAPGRPRCRRPGAARRAGSVVARSAGVQRHRQLQRLGRSARRAAGSTCSGVRSPRWSGSALLIARVRSGRGPGRLGLLHLGQRGLDHLALADQPRRPWTACRAVEDVGGDLRQAAADLGAQLGVPPVQPLARRSRRRATWRCGWRTSRCAAAGPAPASSVPGRTWSRTPAPGSGSCAVIARRREENRSITFWSMPTTSRALPSGAHREPHPERPGQVLFHHPLPHRRRGAAVAVDRLRVDACATCRRRPGPGSGSRCGCAAAGRGCASRAGRTTRSSSRARRPSGRRRRRGARPGRSRPCPRGSPGRPGCRPRSRPRPPADARPTPPPRPPRRAAPGQPLDRTAGAPHCTAVVHCTGSLHCTQCVQCTAGPVGRTAGLHLLGLERGVQHRDRLLHRERRIQERDVLARLLARLEPQSARRSASAPGSAASAAA